MTDRTSLWIAVAVFACLTAVCSAMSILTIYQAFSSFSWMILPKLGIIATIGKGSMWVANHFVALLNQKTQSA